MKELRFIYILFALFLMTGCENYLDITPQGQVKRDELLSTPEGVEDAMYGVYSQMRNQYLYGKELSFGGIEVMAQYFESYGNNKVENLLKYNYDYSSVESMFEVIWTNLYKNISNVNSILTSGYVGNATEFPAKIYRGEALGLRAFMHFDLLRLFTKQITLDADADGIPYATEFSLNTPDFQKAAKVYELIIEDLLTAEQLLADEAQYVGKREFMTMRQIHFNIHAVRATLARVYLTMGDYVNAKKCAQKVVDEAGCTLLKYNEIKGDVAGVLSRKEGIFGIQSSTDFYSYVYDNLWLSTSFFSLNPRDDYASFYEAGGEEDFRLTAYFETAKDPVRFIKVLDKYKLEGNESQRPTDMIQGINMIRLPEMHYIIAECLAREGLLSEAAIELSKVRKSRNVTELEADETTTYDVLISAINDERFKEMIGEGQTFFNMKRLNLPIQTLDGLTLSASDKIYVIPIPDVEYEYRDN